jgi:hypothetical protein
MLLLLAHQHGLQLLRHMRSSSLWKRWMDLRMGELHTGRRRRQGHGLGPLHGGVEIDHGRRRRRGRGPGLRVGEHHAGRRRWRGRRV